HAIYQLHAFLLNPLLQFRDAFRAKIHDGDDVINFRHDKRIDWIFANPIKVREVTIRAVDAFVRECGEPSTTSRMKIGDNVDFAPRLRGKCLSLPDKPTAGHGGGQRQEAAPAQSYLLLAFTSRDR